MAPTDRCELQFLPSSHPGAAPSRDSKRQANAHAARVAHGRVRRFRVIEYQASGSGEKPTEGNSFARSRVSRPSISRRAPGAESAPARVQPVTFDVPNLINELALARRDAFASFARPFNQTESYLFDYYLQVVIPYQSIYCNRLWDREDYRDVMKGDWMRLTLTRDYSLDALLLIACRHLAANRAQGPGKQQHYMNLAVRYKLSCVKVLNQVISDEVASLISDATVATVVMLACDEFWIQEPSTAKRHLDGALQMVNHNGGPQTLGMNGFLEHILYKFWGDVQQGISN